MGSSWAAKPGPEWGGENEAHELVDFGHPESRAGRRCRRGSGLGGKERSCSSPVWPLSAPGQGLWSLVGDDARRQQQNATEKS